MGGKIIVHAELTDHRVLQRHGIRLIAVVICTRFNTGRMTSWKPFTTTYNGSSHCPSGAALMSQRQF